MENASTSSDIFHGQRGGGPLHVIATEDSHGFMSSDDKTALDDVVEDVAEIEEDIGEIEDELEDLEDGIEEDQSEAAGVAQAILVEFRVMNWLLARILATVDDKQEVDLDELKSEEREPIGELSASNTLLMALLQALSNGSIGIDLDAIRQDHSD